MCCSVDAYLTLFYNKSYPEDHRIGVAMNNNSAVSEKTHDKQVVTSPSLCIGALLFCPLGGFCVP